MAESVPVTNEGRYRYDYICGHGELITAHCSLVAIDSSRLPLEVWEIIIDHVGDLRPQDALSGASARLRDLRNCSLVCRDWSHWSRKRLVQYVTIKTFADLSKFKAVLSLPPQYTRYVRWVDIDPPFQSLSSESYRNQLVIGISCSLLALRTLSFTSTYISAFPDEVIEALSHLKRLTHLRFNLVTFKSANSVVRLLSKMPWITELTLRHISIQNDFAVTSESQNTEDHSSSQLRAIEVTHGLLSDHFQTVHRLIPDLPMSHGLKRFQYCGPLDRCSTLSISAFLQIKGSSIQELKLAAYFTTRPNFSMYMDLYHLLMLTLCLRQRLTTVSKSPDIRAYGDLNRVLSGCEWHSPLPSIAFS